MTPREQSRYLQKYEPAILEWLLDLGYEEASLARQARTGRLGRRARAMAIGSCPEFVGEIVMNNGAFAYIRRDDGTLWHRSRSEFSVLPKRTMH